MEPEPQSDKDEENSENSESEEDEGIPDIGEKTSLATSIWRIKTNNLDILIMAASVCVCPDVEVDVDELNDEQVLDLNKMATPYGMAEGDFVRW